MAVTASSREQFRHLALFYHGRGEYLAALAGFIQASQARGDAVFVAVPKGNAQLVHHEFGVNSPHVDLVDMDELGRNPARIIPALRDSLVTVVCPYDSARLPGSVITDAVRTHPAVIRDRQATASVSYLGPPDVPPRCNRALSRPPVHAETLGYSDDLRPVRSFVASRAAGAGLTPSRIPDLVLAISELAANTVRHTEGDGTLQVWHTRGELICQVADTGHLTDPLAWHRPPSEELLGGNGLWLVNQVCDLVQARTGPAGTTIRLHMRLNGHSPRRHASRQTH
jgi:anti-sigma regulatory factor (Ser/Thr protein kinase)